jgi:hypothetical protein
VSFEDYVYIDTIARGMNEYLGSTIRFRDDEKNRKVIVIKTYWTTAHVKIPIQLVSIDSINGAISYSILGEDDRIESVSTLLTEKRLVEEKNYDWL